MMRRKMHAGREKAAGGGGESGKGGGEESEKKVTQSGEKRINWRATFWIFNGMYLLYIYFLSIPRVPMGLKARCWMLACE